MKAGRIAWSRALGAAAWVLIGVSAAPAQVQNEAAKLTASDAARGDHFGTSVAISCDVAVIGAPGDDDGGEDSGAVYTFRRTGADWVQEQKLVASDPFDSDGFGIALALSGDTIMVGAVGTDNVTVNDGCVYVFEWDGVHWVERQKLLASDFGFGAHFGFSVALDGDVAAIGQIGDFFEGASEAGAVYVFRRQGSTWGQEQKLVPPDLGPFDHFGWSVAVGGDLIVGGAPHQEDPGGAAYLFRWNPAPPGRWIQEQKLGASDATGLDWFGASVALDEDVLVAGAPYSDSAYVYEFNGLNWVEVQRIASPGAQFGNFGWAASLSSDWLLVTALGGSAGPGAGTGYLYRRQRPEWILVHTITPSDPAEGDNFGWSTALADQSPIVGAPFNDDACPDDPFCASGSAHVFLLEDCNANGIGDGCEPDCNLNGVPDDCDAVPCPAVTGACCDRDPFRGCTDGVTLEECNSHHCVWTQGTACNDVECPRDTIPTVGTWGFVILSLALLIMAKIRFGSAVHGIRCNGTTLGDQS